MKKKKKIVEENFWPRFSGHKISFLELILQRELSFYPKLQKQPPEVFYKNFEISSNS